MHMNKSKYVFNNLFFFLQLVIINVYASECMYSREKYWLMQHYILCFFMIIHDRGLREMKEG